MKKPIVVSQVGAPVIRARAAPVSFPLEKGVERIIDKLVLAMRTANLVGMAAPQLGTSQRVFVTEIRPTEFRNEGLDPLKIFINPEMLAMSSETEIGYEGCGSVANSNLFGQVERSVSVKVRWSDVAGEVHVDEFSGFLARVIQHEFDHLEGIVFIDRLHTTKTIMSGSEFKNMAHRKA